MSGFAQKMLVNRPPALYLALAVFLVSGSMSPSLLRADLLDEAAVVMACPECGLLTSAIAIPNGIVAIGERGLIVHGTAGNWQQAPVPSRRMLTAVTRTRSGGLIAVGHDALILVSPGPKAAWTIVHTNPDLDMPLLDVWIAGDGRGLAVGAYGMAMVTKNHGRDWSPRQIDPNEAHFYAIREAPDGTLFIAGEFGTVLRSRDRGESWARLEAGWDGTFFGLRARDDGRLLLYGLEGRILESNDNSETWRHLASGVFSALYDGVFLPNGRAVIAGAEGTVLLELPTGFERIDRANRKAITTVLATGPASLLLSGEGGIAHLTLPVPADAK